MQAMRCNGSGDLRLMTVLGDGFLNIGHGCHSAQDFVGSVGVVFFLGFSEFVPHGTD